MGTTMPRLVDRLTEQAIKSISAPGLHADGDGLFLQIGASGARSWIFRFSIHGKARDMGLGSARTVTLADARAKAADQRFIRNKGLDPIEFRKAAKETPQRAVAILDDVGAPAIRTFEQVAESYIAKREGGWRSAKHATQLRQSLRSYVYPLLGHLPVGQVDSDLVIEVLQKIWPRIPETASRLRGEIEKILALATIKKYRQGANPATWKGHLEIVFPTPSRVRKPRPFPALPVGEIPAFVADLRTRKEITAHALSFVIFTAGRTGEVIGARWSEIDFEARTWCIQASRMKSDRSHRVPLSSGALAVLEVMKSHRDELQALGQVTSDFVFPGGKSGRSLSTMALLGLLRRQGWSGFTPHGFRSGFRDWCSENNHSREIAEQALAHVVGGTEGSYFRSDLFELRRAVMESWSIFCCSAPAIGAEVQLLTVGG